MLYTIFFLAITLCLFGTDVQILKLYSKKKKIKDGSVEAELFQLKMYIWSKLIFSEHLPMIEFVTTKGVSLRLINVYVWDVRILIYFYTYKSIQVICGVRIIN